MIKKKEWNMEILINKYYLEFITLIVIALLVIVFIFIKTSQKKESEAAKEIEPKEEKAEAKEEPKEKLHKPVTPKSINRKKRDLLAHNKITKDDFAAFKGTRILIAEDNIINQKVITGLLSTSGIDITIANDGQEALDILQNDSDFSVIFMDVHMPIVDGFEATRVIRKNPKYDHLPIAALSGDTATDDVRNMLNAGIEAHLEKPLKMDALYDILYIYTTGYESQKMPKTNQESLFVSELNSNKGLEICAGDREFYLEILDDFMSKYSDSATTLQEHINVTNSVDADKMLLDISGVAANIGADTLHNATLDLKNSIANPSDLTYISNLKKYKRSLNKVCEEIKKYKSAP